MDSIRLADYTYVGGGYFRKKEPIGIPAPCLHGPEILKYAQALEKELEEIKQLFGGLNASQ